MKNCFLTFLLLALSCFYLSACSDENSQFVPSLTIEKETIDFKNVASKLYIIVATNVEDWGAESNQSWCRAYPEKSNLRIEVDGNDGRSIREAIVTVTAASEKKNIKIRQLGTEAAILVDKEEFKKIDILGGKITFNVTTNVDVDIKLPEWITTVPKNRAMITTEYSYLVKSNIDKSDRTGIIEITEKPGAGSTTEKLAQASITVTQKGVNNYESGLGDDIKDDIKLKIVSGTASSFQPGSDIDKSFDGDYGTIYHSNWTNDGPNYFPITLTYNLEAATDVDYLIYYPRQEGYNGFFKEVEISYSANGSNFTKLMDKDFKGSSTATKVIFDKSIHAKSFRFIVKSGYGDGQGFASCAEMEFYAKNPATFDYKTLFEDELCTKLKSGITQADIDKCEYPFFKTLAYYMLLDQYNPEFRVNEFKAYPDPNIQARTNKTNPYSYLDNPTGISVKEGENLIVLVGDTYGHSIGLRVQNLDVTTDGFGGKSYPLNKGVNKLAIKEKGLAYVIYQTDVLDDPSALPIKMHFVSGTVNGYFDSRIHKGRWNELLGKATNKHFDVIGEYAHLTFETANFRQYTGGRGEELIKAYDDFVYYEQLLMGLKKYDRMFKNHMYLNVMYTKDAYMYATSYHTAYHSGTMPELCNPQSLKTGSCWGPAHEIGHCNQTRPGLLWLGTTEVTNNIMSQYVQTALLKQDSRIQAEDMGNNYRNRYGAAWTKIIAAKAPHATEGDVFCKLVPLWQLELYFGRALGRSPLTQSDFGGFYPDVYEHVRSNANLDTPGLQQTEFVYICSKASGYNLLDFFTKWGFLTPVNVELDDYGKGTMEVTQARIDEIKRRVEALGLPKPNVALEYISDNTWELYRNMPSIIKGSATRSGKRLTMTNWKNVVAYEVVDIAGGEKNIVAISSGETTPSTVQWFDLPGDWKSSYRVYAVAANNDRIEVTF